MIYCKPLNIYFIDVTLQLFYNRFYDLFDEIISDEFTKLEPK